MRRLTLEAATESLASAQKPGDGVPAYLRWVNRPLGGQVAVRAAVLGMSPNQLTAVSAALGLAGVVSIVVLPSTSAGLLGALLLLLGYVFDSADGQLARIQRRGGPAGEWLDHVVDGVRAPLVHAALVVHLATHAVAGWLPIIALLFTVLVSSWFLSQLLAEKLLPKRSSPTTGQRGTIESFVKQPQDPSTTYVVIAFLGVPALFAAAYVLLFAWLLLGFVLSLGRKYRQLSLA